MGCLGVDILGPGCDQGSAIGILHSQDVPFLLLTAHFNDEGGMELGVRGVGGWGGGGHRVEGVEKGQRGGRWTGGG